MRRKVERLIVVLILSLYLPVVAQCHFLAEKPDISDLLSLPDDEINVFAAALLISGESYSTNPKDHWDHFHALSVEFQEFIKPARTDLERLRGLRNFLFKKKNISARGDETGLITNLGLSHYITDKGNCVPLSILMASLAHQAGIKTKIQLSLHHALISYTHGESVYYIESADDDGGVYRTLEHWSEKYQGDVFQPLNNTQVIAALYQTIGMRFYHDADITRSTECLHKALEIDTTLAGANLYIGNVLLQQKKYDEALRHYQTVLQFNQSSDVYDAYAAALYNKAIQSYDKGNKSSAIELFKQITSILPDTHNEAHRPYFMLGSIYARQYEFDLALDNLHHSLALNPKQPAAYLIAGICHHKLNYLPEAGNDFKKALSYSPPPEYRHTYEGVADFFVAVTPDYETAWLAVKRLRELGGEYPKEKLDRLIQVSGKQE